MIEIKANFAPDLKGISAACSAAETIVAVQIEKDTRPFVPALTMSLNQRTRVIGSTIVYPAPYARYLYMGKVMVDSATGRGAMKIPDVGYRFHKGAKLMATDRPLTYTKTVHPKAQDHWMEASKKQNISKWKQVAAKAVAAYGK